MAVISPDKLEAPPWLYARLARGPLFHWIYRRQVADLAAHLFPGTRLLDVGTGPGYLLDHLAAKRPDLQAFGLDLSFKMLYYGERQMAASRSRRPLSFLTARVEALPFPNQTFHQVLASLSLHHWTVPEIGLAEVFRILKPGGRAWIYEFSREVSPTALRRFSREDGLPFFLVYLAYLSLKWGHSLGFADFARLFAKAGITHWQVSPVHHLFWRAEFWKPEK
ncbi:MAG: class I SAM-dependent methyltransferase [Thermodesulfobacteriota bacterium]